MAAATRHKRPSGAASPRTRHWTLAASRSDGSLCSSSSEATTKQLEPSDQRRLLDIARRAIEAAVCRSPDPGTYGGAPSPAVAESAAAFVTLREQGELRGCIGLMRFDVPLWINVRDAAAAAALDDPRFLPVTESELAALEVEVSVLEPPAELLDPAAFEAGRHGIVVEKGLRRALLLPQVATEMGWGAEQMLDAVCRKAGLPGTAWRDKETRLFVFESVCFGEREPAASSDPSPTS
ncbi:MAG TPA: AmmeMemoRadiSam system protein A [Candidatus Limnocylindrales bacterium]|nr:AmmeMemoRadiSam system protein A [Candidatus Limnocylindrales bacterium]